MIDWNKYPCRQTVFDNDLGRLLNEDQQIGLLDIAVIASQASGQDFEYAVKELLYIAGQTINSVKNKT